MTALIGRLFKRLRGECLGASTVELALTLVPTLALLLGGIDFCRYYWTQHVVTAAATEACRMAILNEPTDTEVRSKAQKTVTDGQIKAAPTITLTARESGKPVSVNVSVPFQFVVLGDFGVDVTGVNKVASKSTMVHVP